MVKDRFKAIIITASTTTLIFYSTIKGETLAPQLLYQKDGAAANQALGLHVSGGKDIDGDGTSDFIIGTTFSRAYVYSGANGTLLYDVVGATIACIGDINGDNKSDFMTALPGTAAGTTFIYSGSDGNLLYTKNGYTSGDRFGSSLGVAGDVDGDGLRDFIIGAERADSGSSTDVGAAYIYSGSTGTLLFQKFGNEDHERSGWSVNGAGDINDDGLDDLIVGAPLARPGGLFRAGSVYICSGGTGELLYKKDGINEDGWFGFSTDGLGDINGDGKSDYIVGVPLLDSTEIRATGGVLVYSGADGNLLLQKRGLDSFTVFGESVSGTGDVDGDGVVDFIVGARLADPNNLADAGSAYVFSGIDGSLLFQINGDSAGHQLGRAVGRAGDVNGDGRCDVIIGAPGADPGGLTDAGSAFVYGLVATDVTENKGTPPERFELSQNYPNPFNPTTTIRYYLPKREKVTLEVFNLLGEQVKTLANEEQTAGEHTVTWDGKDKGGKTLPSGIYFYRLKGKDLSETKKMLLLK